MVFLKKLKSFFYGWSRFELIWLIVSSLVMITLSVLWRDNILALVSGLTGIIGVVLCAKGRISTYFFADINVALYAYLCWGNKLYGEMMMNAFYFLPMNVLGFFLWKRHKARGGEVKTRNLTPRGIIIMSAGAAAAIIAYWKLLAYLSGSLPFIDSITTVLSVIALILQVTRYSEQWILWIIINIASIIMWFMMTLDGDTSGVTMIVMWSAYLLNSIYGYLNWRKLARAEE